MFIKSAQTTVHDTRGLDIIHEVRLFLEENLHRDITILLLCRKFGINRTKLQEEFRQLFGIPIYTFLFQVRMDRACSLLTGTDKTIKAIALGSGYKSVSGFSRAFTKIYKISPIEYRGRCATNIKTDDWSTGRFG